MTDCTSLGVVSFCAAVFGPALIVQNTTIPIVTGSGNPQVILHGNEAKNWTSSTSSSECKIVFDFKKRKFKPTGYMVQKANIDWRTWVLEGQTEGGSWLVLDRRENDSTMLTQHGCYTFTAEDKGDSFRFIQLKFEGVNGANEWKMSSEAIDFYGTLS
jgi:hypothetical protein